jgi:hypothetical protein
MNSDDYGSKESQDALWAHKRCVRPGRWLPDSLGLQIYFAAGTGACAAFSIRAATASGCEM